MGKKLKEKKCLMKGEKKVCKVIVLIAVTEYDNVIEYISFEFEELMRGKGAECSSHAFTNESI